MDHAHAAVKLQNMYRSFRHRRMLADTIIMELWGHAIDFARLNISTTFFFQCMNERSSNTRWTRIGFNASVVGRGVSENDKAQILAFQHWIEAIDPRHRYGHCLRLYYNQWCRSNAGNQPFFYWLDVGDGKVIDLPECSKSVLQEQCVKYLGPLERNRYEYIVSGGKVVHKQSGGDLHTQLEGISRGRDKWIFVVSTSGRLYVGKKEKGRFHHSSFLAGGATVAAGSLVVEHGILKYISGYSGHYRPTDDSIYRFLSFLGEHGVNLNGVEIDRVTPVIA
ncbi:IQ domain-containing protein IQM3-like [Juglans microcarpa x Juglans regia]|uniref:IQ domain-containing protein IQM3-like n=1 Tax=Juglans microcarpa x Juglans regia TaxID=2249226 RepID=UPI001B7D9E47|nr:IQ domain-containing protein IQM3-like [Juglans microcarpa x Juglans regia]